MALEHSPNSPLPSRPHPYKKVFGQAWKIIKKYKRLWWLGLLSSCSASIGVPRGIPLTFGNYFSHMTSTPPEFMSHRFAWFIFLQENPYIIPVVMITLLTLTYLVYPIIGARALTKIIRMTNGIHQGAESGVLRQPLSGDDLESFKRIRNLYLVIGGVNLSLSLILSGLVSLVVPLIPLNIALILNSLPAIVTPLVQLFIIGVSTIIVTESITAREAISHFFMILRKHTAKVVLTNLGLTGIALALQIITTIPAIGLSFLFALTLFFLPARFMISFSATIAIVIVIYILYYLFVIGVFGIYQGYKNITAALTYQHIIDKGQSAPPYRETQEHGESAKGVS
jgi:hypothetical protein